MKKVVKKSVKKYGVGGTNGTPKKDSMPVPSKQVRSGEGAPKKKIEFYGSPTYRWQVTKTEADQRLDKMDNLKNSMQKQKKGGSVKRKTK